MLTRKRSSVYGSRHLIYDVPLPIDECQSEDVVMRSHRRRGSSFQSRRRPASQASGTSSRLSGISNNSSDFQRSLLTVSCSSAGSCASSNITLEMGQIPTGGELPPISNATQSWQPQTLTVPAKRPVTRNVSSPPNLTHYKLKTQTQQPQQCDSTDAALVADLVKAKSSTMRSESAAGGFQQFLRRWSNRRSNKPLRPISATNSIK